MSHEGVFTTCCKCRTTMWLPQELELTARRSPDIAFWCPYGHPLHYKQRDRSKDPPPEPSPPVRDEQGENVIDFPLRGA